MMHYTCIFYRNSCSVSCYLPRCKDQYEWTWLYMLTA